MVTIQELYDLEHTQAKSYLEQFTYPWEALKGIKDFIVQLGSTLGDDYQEVSPRSGYIGRQRWHPLPIWVPPASSAQVPRCATVPLSGAAPWWERTAWWATLWS